MKGTLTLFVMSEIVHALVFLSDINSIFVDQSEICEIISGESPSNVACETGDIHKSELEGLYCCNVLLLKLKIRWAIWGDVPFHIKCNKSRTKCKPVRVLHVKDRKQLYWEKQKEMTWDKRPLSSDSSREKSSCRLFLSDSETFQ